MATPWPEAGAPPAQQHLAAAGYLQREVVSPSALPPAVLGRGIPASGILRPIIPDQAAAQGSGQPTLAGSQEWALPKLEVAAAGREMPSLPETFWESCATVAPEPAERWLSLAAPREALFAAPSARIQRFTMTAETAECFRDVSDAPPPPVETWMPGPPAQAAERWIEPVMADASARVATALGAAVPSAVCSAAPAVAGFAQLPAAEAVERWIEPAMAGPSSASVHEPRLAPFAIPAEPPAILGDPADAPPPVSEAWAPAPAAEPVEAWLQPAAADAVLAVAISLPAATALAVPGCAPRMAGAELSAAPQAVESWIEPVSAEQVAYRVPELRTLPFAITASRPEILRDPGDAPPPLAETWAPVPTAEPVERWLLAGTAPAASWAPAPVQLPVPEAATLHSTPELAGAADAPAAQAAERWIEPAFAAAIAPKLRIAIPEPKLSVVAPFVPFVPQFARPHAAEPAAAFVAPAFHPLPVHPQVVFPAMPHRIGPAHGDQGHSPAKAPAAFGPEAAPVESMPAARKEPIPISSGPALLPVEAAKPAAAQLAPAGVTEIYPAAARSGAGAPPQPRLSPVSTLAAQAPDVRIEQAEPRVPQPGLFSLEYYCHRGTGTPSRRMRWATPGIPPAALRFQMKPVFESLEEQAPPKPARKGLAFAEIFSLPEARKQASRSNLSYIGKIAAGIMVATSLWFGSKVADFAKQPATVAQESPAVQRPVESRPLVARGTEPKTGTVARIRRAIASRASVQVQDTFRGDMQAWGAGPKEWAPGWSRSPEGFVRVGDLALFRPTQKFTDYRLEFYGQIEKKSIGWVMRARDKQNYYAMKFKVIEPGLRPIIAMEHYPVFGGKKGHEIHTPLSVMVHNNTPYHVAVDVKGNHFVASIEGEKVDEWTDDTPVSGAVGFFSDAGEAARLYWAKVSKNQDWIGRFCAYLAGDEASRTAELWNPGPPPDAPAPPAPRPHDVILTACEVRPEEKSSPAGARPARNWSLPLWIS